MLFLNDKGLRPQGWAELQRWLPPLVLLCWKPARLHPAPQEGMSDGVRFLHPRCFFQLSLKPRRRFWSVSSLLLDRDARALQLAIWVPCHPEMSLLHLTDDLHGPYWSPP